LVKKFYLKKEGLKSSFFISKSNERIRYINLISEMWKNKPNPIVPEILIEYAVFDMAELSKDRC